MNTRYKVWCIQ